jgi:hypothetical protein
MTGHRVHTEAPSMKYGSVAGHGPVGVIDDRIRQAGSSFREKYWGLHSRWTQQKQSILKMSACELELPAAAGLS